MNLKGVLKLLRDPRFQTPDWSIRTERDPIRLGEYGRREVYSFAGKPVFQIEISFSPPKTTAKRLRGAK